MCASRLFESYPRAYNDDDDDDDDSVHYLLPLNGLKQDNAAEWMEDWRLIVLIIGQTVASKISVRGLIWMRVRHLKNIKYHLDC